MTENGNEHSGLQITIERFGSGPEVTDAVRETVSDHPSVQEYLDGTRHKLLSVRLLDAEVEGLKPGECALIDSGTARHLTSEGKFVLAWSTEKREP